MSERTHYEECWREHHECAIKEIERLLEDAELKRCSRTLIYRAC